MSLASPIKENIDLWLAYSTEVQLIFVMAESMAACMQTWCWRSSREFFTWFHRQKEVIVTDWPGLSFKDLKAHSLVTYLLQHLLHEGHLS